MMVFHESPNADVWRSEVSSAAAKGDATRLLQLTRSRIAEGATAAEYGVLAGHIRKFGRERARDLGLNDIRGFIARSVTVEPLLSHLIAEAAMAGIWMQVELGGYGSFFDELIRPDGALAKFQPDLVFLLTDIEDCAGLLRPACGNGAAAQIEKELSGSAERLTQALRQFRANVHARAVVQGFVVPDQPILGEVTDCNVSTGEGVAVARLNAALQ